MDIPSQPINIVTKKISWHKSCQQTEQKSPENESYVPHMVVGEPTDAEVEKYNTITCWTQHLDKVIDSNPGFSRYISEGIMCLNQSTPNETDDTGPMDQLSQDIGQITSTKQSQWFDNSHPLGQSGQERDQESNNNSNNIPVCRIVFCFRLTLLNVKKQF